MKRSMWAVAVLILWPVANMVGQVKAGDAESLLEALSNLTSNSKLTIPEGTYMIPARMEINNLENVVIEGDGNVDIQLTDANDAVFMVYDCKNITVRNLHLKHYVPDENQVCTGGVLNLSSTDNVTVERCDLNGCGVVGISGWGNTGLKVRENYIHDNSYAGISLVSPSGQELLIVNGEMPLEGVELEGNMIEDNGSPKSRVEALFDQVEWLDEEAGHKAIVENSTCVKKKKVSTGDGFFQYASGTVTVIYAGIEWGDFAHLNVIVKGGATSFWVDGGLDIDYIETNDQFLGKEVKIDWVERDMDLREFSGMIERVYVAVKFTPLD